VTACCLELVVLYCLGALELHFSTSTSRFHSNQDAARS
jgi:hypothetical protein